MKEIWKVIYGNPLMYYPLCAVLGIVAIFGTAFLIVLSLANPVIGALGFCAFVGILAGYGMKQ